MDITDWIRTALTVVLVTILCGCRVSSDDIAGMYVLQDAEVTMTLELFRDGKYSQRIAYNKRHEEEKWQGTWLYNGNSGDVELTGQLLMYVAIKGTSAKKLERHDGVALLPAERHLSGVVLGSDEGELYQKR